MNVEVTLEEFYYGCKKEILFERLTLKGDKKSEKFVIAKKEIEIKPGMGEWTEMVFKGEGHERFGHEVSDLKVKLV